ncbi:hypothetical protein BDW62DRAFT_181462 [Aspergillus aurantiobrunneus]
MTVSRVLSAPTALVAHTVALSIAPIYTFGLDRAWKSSSLAPTIRRIKKDPFLHLECPSRPDVGSHSTFGKL